MREVLKKSFEKIYCINLNDRVDKWEKCRMIFKKHKIEDLVHRWEATDPKNKNKKGDCV